MGFYCCDLDIGELCKLVKAPVRLVDFTVDHTSKTDVLGDVLCEHYTETVETLDQPRTDVRVLRRFRNLKECELDLGQVVLMNTHNKDLPRWKYKGEDPAMNAAVIYITDLRELLPSSIQKIKLSANDLTHPPYQTLTGWPVASKDLLNMIADCVDHPQFAQVKEVCIWTICSNLKTGRGLDESFTWDPEALARIEARGVDLHSWNKDGSELSSEEHVKMHSSYAGLGLIETFPKPLVRNRERSE